MTPAHAEMKSVGPAPGGASSLEVIGVGKRFGDLHALSDVSLRVPAGSFHALLGENGAGKSTLVKCVVGYQQPDQGSVVVADRERLIRSPREAAALGIGMVYQHFTLVPHMTVAENLVMARTDTPQFINWRRANAELKAFLATMPFPIPLHVPAASLAAGEKQKVEIIRQLYLQRRLLILDEPTSVLTPAEADEVLGMLHHLSQRGEVTVVMITHKLREVKAFTESVSVLRGGRYVGGGSTADLSAADLAELMVGERDAGGGTTRKRSTTGKNVLQVEDLCASDDQGVTAVEGASLTVASGEILGLVGVSGNGQKELVEVLAGQRERDSGQVSINGSPYHARRQEMTVHGVAVLPEEPLRNACVASMSVADNLAFRDFDRPPQGRFGWLFKRPRRKRAERLIDAFSISTPGPEAPIGQLSGGNVQRAVLARELSGDVRLLIAANPVFGLDFRAVEEIHGRLREARDRGAAVFLISEDLDEVLELADRIVVMYEGRVTYMTDGASADGAAIGRTMAGQTA